VKSRVGLPASAQVYPGAALAWHRDLTLVRRLLGAGPHRVFSLDCLPIAEGVLPSPLLLFWHQPLSRNFCKVASGGGVRQGLLHFSIGMLALVICWREAAWLGPDP
jgi:hypothetical protein